MTNVTMETAPPPFDKAASYDRLRAQGLSHGDAIAKTELAAKAAQYDFLRSKGISHDDAVHHIELGSRPWVVEDEEGKVTELPKGAKQRDTRRPIGTGETIANVARAGVQGLTSGFGDEISGGVAALGALADPTKSMSDVKAAYTKTRDTERGNEAAFAKEHRIADLIAKATGSIVPTLASIGTAAPLATGAGRAILRSIGVGAGQGAVTGYGYSDTGDLRDVGEGALYGGLTGGVVSGAGQVAQKVVRAVKSLPLTARDWVSIARSGFRAATGRAPLMRDIARMADRAGATVDEGATAGVRAATNEAAAVPGGATAETVEALTDQTPVVRGAANPMPESPELAAKLNRLFRNPPGARRTNWPPPDQGPQGPALVPESPTAAPNAVGAEVRSDILLPETRARVQRGATRGQLRYREDVLDLPKRTPEPPQGIPPDPSGEPDDYTAALAASIKRLVRGPFNQIRRIP